MDARTAIPPPLRDASLKPWHLIFLCAVIFSVAAMLGVTWGRSIDPAIRFAWDELVIHAMAAMGMMLLIAIVPQLRRSLPCLYARPRVPLESWDAIVFVAVMLAWGYGAHRFLVLFPLIQWQPRLLAVFTQDHAGPSGSMFILLWSVTSVVLSPVVEELLFRGFLQNLWQRRWGTWPAVIFSAIAFGSMHFQYAAFATVAGVFLSLVYLKYRSLWPGTLLHSLYNLVANPFLVAPYFAKPVDGIGSIEAWLPELALTVMFFPLLFLFWRRFRPA